MKIGIIPAAIDKSCAGILTNFGYGRSYSSSKFESASDFPKKINMARNVVI